MPPLAGGDQVGHASSMTSSPTKRAQPLTSPTWSSAHTRRSPLPVVVAGRPETLGTSDGAAAPPVSVALSRLSTDIEGPITWGWR
ncbi:hypothetical protein ABT344_00805 [Micromonospora carbonacea]|uniref:hypothetical protein n=1 Tax=Micromonospora carbonacea TaxID=47853 RepID=UPI0033345DC3